MSKYTYFEIKDKMAELKFTNELFGHISNAKSEVKNALTNNRGVLDEDAIFEKKLRTILYELDELKVIVTRAYNNEREKLLMKVTEKEVNE